jgi:periplasmic copper chaperone A
VRSCAAREFSQLRNILPAALCGLLVSLAVNAQTPALQASDAWIRVVPGSPMAAAYLTLHNAGREPVVVTGVTSPRIASAMIHETQLSNGQSSMRPHPALRIGAGETVRLAPGGLHIMLEQTSRPLAVGEAVVLTLKLQDGAPLIVTARVRALGAGPT